MGTTNEIPQDVIDAAKEFVKVASKHNLRDFNLEFKFQEGDTTKNTVSWNWGRHGEDIRRFRIFTELRLNKNVTF